MNQNQKRVCVFAQIYLSSYYAEEEARERCAEFLRDESLLRALGIAAEGLKEEEQQLLLGRALAVLSREKALDAEIGAVSRGWKISRMSLVDLCILRLAAYEMFCDEEIPLKVAINEAVELAKKFGGRDSPAFVNAILGKLVKGREA